ncbi:hypothetical protein H2201_006152 [Coniosporium apollinis]|uniref:Enoyl reductase (ER) domain-containing protein n=1 Tax=Coniosporium apollinis TaxID=61459 RepID=A0ABQ9NMV3_9PEZI|nr:hypothetical protein H2201_006152 [Coniosporium apollinis]
MATPFPPSTIKAWQINPSAPLPKPKPGQHLVQAIATALNPVDYKPAEIPVVGRLIVPKPATPGIDFAGRIIVPATGSPLKRGQLVFGMAGTNPLAGGALAEFTLAETENAVALPDGVDAVDAATIGVAALTAYQSIVPRVNKGDHVFINGGSGGTGVFGIQIAKAVGCHVTTTCSTANIELCKSLGADEVVDYRKQAVVEALKGSGRTFDHVVDNVGADLNLYWRCHEYTNPQAVYVMVGGTPSFGFAVGMFKMMLWPGFLGGGKRKFAGFFPKPKYEDLEQIGMWMKEAKVRAIIDQKFSFEQAPKAFEKLKTGRAKGKIVVDVASETYRKAWSE